MDGELYFLGKIKTAPAGRKYEHVQQEKSQMRTSVIYDITFPFIFYFLKSWRMKYLDYKNMQIS
jgi:hypothetical protein